jgi:hypothetical protein
MRERRHLPVAGEETVLEINFGRCLVVWQVLRSHWRGISDCKEFAALTSSVP